MRLFAKEYTRFFLMMLFFCVGLISSRETAYPETAWDHMLMQMLFFLSVLGLGLMILVWVLRAITKVRNGEGTAAD